MSQKHTSSKIKSKQKHTNRVKKQIQDNSELIKKKFIIKRKLFDKGIFAAATMSICFIVIGIILFNVSLWWIGLIFIIISILQLALSLYILYHLHWGFANLQTIYKFKKSWIIFLLTGNITGAIYIGLLINKK